MNLDGTHVTDLEPLAACETITSIAIRNTRVVDVSVLRALPNLQTLAAEGAPIDLDTVAGLTQIRVLELSPVSQNLEPLAGLELFDLTIDSDTVTDIEGLSGQFITLLTLRLPLMRDASALADMEVHFLDLSAPHLVDVRPLLEIEGLERLSLFTAADLEPLAAGCEFEMFEYLHISSPRGSVSRETRYSLVRCAEIFEFHEYTEDPYSWP